MIFFSQRVGRNLSFKVPLKVPVRTWLSETDPLASSGICLAVACSAFFSWCYFEDHARTWFSGQDHQHSCLENGPRLKMYFLSLKMRIFQPAMLVYQRLC